MSFYRKIARKLKTVSLISSFREEKLHFSRRVVLAFSAIVLVPILALFAVIISLMNAQSMKGLESICELEVRMNAEKLYENIQSYELIDKMIRANSELSLFITSPENRDESEVIRTVKEQSLVLERILSVEPSIYAIRVFTESSLVPERFPVILHSDRENLNLLHQWEFNYVADYLGNLKSQEAPSVCLTRELLNGKRKIGWIQVAMRMENFFPFMLRTQVPYQHDFIFMGTSDSELKQLCSESPECKAVRLSKKEIGRVSKKIQQRTGAGRQVKNYTTLLGKNNVFAWKEIPELGIYIVHSCETGMVSASIVATVLVSILALVFTAMCFFFIVRHTANSLFRGVYSVMDGMRRVKEGDLSVQIAENAPNEVRETQAAFNAMTRQLSSQIEQIRTEQQLIADTEMKAMQNQINAHFLYNVLETIHMQAVLANDDAVAESILILGKMMRYCLRWRIHTVTLDKEIEYIEAYVSILNIRNDYAISLENKIPSELNEIKIPKMIVQPFVENAFIHAIEPLAQDSVITIWAERDEAEKKLWLCVQDYGIGMDKEVLDGIMNYLSDDSYERDSQGSIGIKNIQQRLTMFYGKDYRLKIISEPGKGTLVKVPLPIEGDTRP